MRAGDAGVQQGSGGDPAGGVHRGLRRTGRTLARCPASLGAAPPARQPSRTGQICRRGGHGRTCCTPRAISRCPGRRSRSGRPDEADREIEQPYLGSPAERLASNDFAELSDAELAELAAADARRSRWRVPSRRSQAPQARRPGGRRTDMRSTLRQARRTGGHAFRLIGEVAGEAAAAAGGALRHLRVDGAVRAGNDPAAVLCGGRGRRRGIQLRHPADAADDCAGPFDAGGRAGQGRRRRRRTGTAAPRSARRSRSSTTYTGGAAWPGARSC